MATEKTPLKIYRGINGTSGTVPALQAGTLIFNEGLGFLTLDVNTSKATVSDAAKALLKDTVDFINESLNSTDAFKILSSNDNNNIMRLPLLASGAFYSTYADRATQADIAHYTQSANDVAKNWKHSISDSFLHNTNNEYIISNNNQIQRQITKINNSIETEVVTSNDDTFTDVLMDMQSTLQPLTFYNNITISNQYGLAIDPASENNYLDLGYLNPSLYLEQYATLMTEDNIILAPRAYSNAEYDQKIVLQRYNNKKIEDIVIIKNNLKSIFNLGITASSSYTPADDYDLVTVAYMRDNAGGKAIFRRWA